MRGQKVVEAFMHALDEGDEARLDELMDEGFRYGHEGMPGLLDRAQFLAFVRRLRAGLPDLRFHSGPVSDDDVVWTDIRVEGTQTEFLDLTAFGLGAVDATTTRVVLPTERAVFIVDGGRVLYHGVVATDGGGWAGLFEQLGVRLAPGVAA